MPGLLTATRNWFRDYKIPTGKPANLFAFDGEYQDMDSTLSVVQGCHKAWRTLIQGEFAEKSKSPSTRRAGSNVIIKDEPLPSSEIPSEVNKWYYI